MKKGRTLAQIKASKPTSDYDAAYDVTPAAADQFVEVVYQSLSGKK